jgi:hypothetical protein
VEHYTGGEDSLAGGKCNRCLLLPLEANHGYQITVDGVNVRFWKAQSAVSRKRIHGSHFTTGEAIFGV